MTEPTQAQIEAAAKAYAEINGHRGESHYSAICAALTAAAQVVDERYWVDTDTAFKEGVAATIERCAQVAESASHLSLLNPSPGDIGRRIAAAIRALATEKNDG